MTSIAAKDLRSTDTIILDGEPCSIIHRQGIGYARSNGGPIRLAATRPDGSVACVDLAANDVVEVDR